MSNNIPKIPNQKEYKDLTPFDLVLIQKFPFIEEDFDAINMYGILSKIKDYLNNVIANEQIVTENQQSLYNSFKDLHDYVDNYFNNLDVQEEINHKLDEMLANGDLEEIIGDYIMKKLDYYLIDTTITTEQLQELLNINRDKIIEFKNGTYNFESPLRLNKNTKLICNNAVINCSNRHIFYNFKITDTNVLEYNGNGNIEIIGGKFNAGFSFIHAKNVIFKDLYFYHVENDHCFELCGCKNILIENCKFEGVLSQASDRQFVECIQIENATHTNFPWITDGSNTFDNTPCENLEIKNCNFLQTDIGTHRLYTAIGGHTYLEDYPHKNISIHNNNFTNPLAYAIRLHNSKNVEIFSNKMIKTGDYMLNRSYALIGFYNGASLVNIHDNYIDGSLLVFYLANDSKDITIKNNIIKNVKYHDTTEIADNYGYVIYYRGCENLIFSNNELIDILGGILYSLADSTLNGSSTEFSYNTIRYTLENIENIYSYLLRFYGTEKVIVKGNTVDLPLNKYFIRLHSNVNDVFISDNKMKYYNRYLDLNGYIGSLDKVFNIPIVGYTGDSVIIEDTNLNVDYTDFNKLILAFGSQASTIIQCLYSLTIGDKLDARTFNFPIYTSGGSTPIKASLTLNNDGTFIFTCEETSLKLRRITFINE